MFWVKDILFLFEGKSARNHIGFIGTITLKKLNPNLSTFTAKNRCEHG